jgi:Gpi18-like mannosyltransferase
VSVLSDVRRASPVQAIGVALGIVAIAVIYLLRLNRAAGLMVDDAYYVMLGRALAEGSGYRLINSATVQMLPLYPPGFPFLLSLVFRVAPDFPENVLLLKAVSVVALLATALLTYVYLRRRQVTPRLSATAAAGIATMPALVFLATSTLMSECVFALVQLSAIVVLDRTADSSRARARWLIVAGAVMAAAAVLVRSAGMGLVIAATLWFVGRREWSRAVLFATAVA